MYYILMGILPTYILLISSSTVTYMTRINKQCYRNKINNLVNRKERNKQTQLNFNKKINI